MKQLRKFNLHTFVTSIIILTKAKILKERNLLGYNLSYSVSLLDNFNQEQKNYHVSMFQRNITTCVTD